jgi:hypothetical protein
MCHEKLNELKITSSNVNIFFFECCTFLQPSRSFRLFYFDRRTVKDIRNKHFDEKQSKFFLAEKGLYVVLAKTAHTPLKQCVILTCKFCK